VLTRAGSNVVVESVGRGVQYGGKPVAAHTRLEPAEDHAYSFTWSCCRANLIQRGNALYLPTNPRRPISRTAIIQMVEMVRTGWKVLDLGPMGPVFGSEENHYADC
jgi:hypothetical protein